MDSILAMSIFTALNFQVAAFDSQSRWHIFLRHSYVYDKLYLKLQERLVCNQDATQTADLVLNMLKLYTISDLHNIIHIS